jgi:hypothetical protein
VSRGRVALAVAGLLLAVFVVLLASDLRSWQHAVRAGDIRFAQDPAGARWNASTILPAGLSRSILGISDQLAYRRTAQRFVAVDALGAGFDNGFSESRKRAELEVALTNLARSGDRKRDSAADNLLGIFAYADSKPVGATAPAPVDRAVADFRSAVQLDPQNEYAKFNLEWLLRELVATGKRDNGSSSTAGGNVKSKKGAGGSPPGHGY